MKTLGWMAITIAWTSLGSASAQVTQLVSVSAQGAQENAGGLGYGPSMTPDGRFVAFDSRGDNLVPGDANGMMDVFVRDRTNGTTELVSISTSGAQGNDHSSHPTISADGRYVAFASWANNLVSGDTNGLEDIFLRDRTSGTTTRLTTSDVHDFQISADGRFLAYGAVYSNGLVESFVLDIQAGTADIVSRSSLGSIATGDSEYGISISGDGRYVAFGSAATNLVPGYFAGNVYIRDRQTNTTDVFSVNRFGAAPNGWSFRPSLSSNGRFLTFTSDASDLVPGDVNGTRDIFVRDLLSGTNELISVDSVGTEGNDPSEESFTSADGRYVVFKSDATNLVAGDTNATNDAFVRDRALATTDRVNLGFDGREANGPAFSPSISADGRYVAFASNADNLLQHDVNAAEVDAFVRDRAHPQSTSLCEPGVSGVIGCPCSNPSSGPDRGCDNSSSTGGATLVASGGEYLSSDTIVFSTSGEKPTATSVVMQGTARIAAGAIYGQGVRCVGGTAKRLYTKAASGGSITAPDFGAGDVSVSERSAALGDVIVAGSTRWYLAFYRDPMVLGGCPSTATFNCTQTRGILWTP